MKKTNLLSLCILALLSVMVSTLTGQIQVNASYSACPGQTITITPVWNNVSNITYQLTAPAGVPTQVPSTFTLVGGTIGTQSYTLSGAGNANSGPVTSTVYFSFTTTAPAALSITQTPSSFGGNYCFGSNATFTAPIGAPNYQVAGGCAGNMNSTSNILTISNLNAGCAGIYTISATINGCARTGTTQINVAPNSQITVSSPTTLCEGVNYNFNFTAQLANGTDYGWLNQINSQVSGGFSGPAVLAWAGVYTATANIYYNSVIKCPKSATTSIQVVQTSQVTAGASPSGVVCQGQNLNLNATAPQASGFTWNGPQSFFSTAQNPVISQIIPANNGTYSVTALFLGGNITCTTGAQVNIQVVPVTQPVITMSASVCENNPVVMSVTGGQNATFSWSGPCMVGGVGTSTSIAVASTSCSGIYYATAMYQIGSTQCPATASAALNVVPVNSITVVPPTPVCTPDNGFLQASSPGANSFKWVGPLNFMSPGANVTVYNPTPANSGIYTVTATFGGGNITCTKDNTVQLTVNPVLNFSLTPWQQICYNTPVNIAGPGGATSYTWTSSNGFYSNLQNMTLPAAQPKHAGTYTLQVALGPCITRASSELVVLDPISFTLVPQDKTVCKGDTVYLEGAVTGGSQNYAYVWSPGLFMSSPYGSIKTIVPNGSVQFNLIAHDIACPNYTIAKTVNINVNQPVVPDLQLSPGYGCAPLEMLYNSKTRNQAAIITYDWGNKLVEQRDAKTDSFYFALKKPGTYHLTVYTKAFNGCGYLYEYPFEINVYPSPGSDFYVTPEKPTTADKVTFNPVNGYEPVIHYRWEFLGGTNLLDTTTVKPLTVTPNSDTSNVKNPLRQYNMAGNYQAVLITTNDWGCIDTVYKTVSIIDDLNIYIPNSFTPNGDGVNDRFFVKGMGMKLENFSLQVIDRWGNIVFSTKDINESWDGMVRGAPARDGTYTVIVKVVGMNGEGRKEMTSYVNVIK